MAGIEEKRPEPKAVQRHEFKNKKEVFCAVCFRAHSLELVKKVFFRRISATDEFAKIGNFQEIGNAQESTTKIAAYSILAGFLRNIEKVSI